MKKKHAIIAICTFVVLTVSYLFYALSIEQKPKATWPSTDSTQVNNVNIETDSITSLP